MLKKRILLVDDDEDHCQALYLWLAKMGFDVATAANGDEALRLLKTSALPDLILTDFMMPYVNGLELVRFIKFKLELVHTPVVVMSSNGDPENRRRAAELGAVAYLQKSIGARELAATVARIAQEQTPAASARAEMLAMQKDLRSLLRFAASAEGVPPEVQRALASAEWIAEVLFPAVEA